MAIVIFTKKQVLDRITQKASKFKSNAAAARAWGVTAPVLCSVLKGDIPPPPRLCEAVGLQRVKLYATGVEQRHLD